MELGQKSKSSARLDHTLRRRIEPSTKELKVVRYASRAATVQNVDFVDSIRMQDQHGGVSWDRVLAKHAAVVQLELEPKRLEGGAYEALPVPFLQKL